MESMDTITLPDDRTLAYDVTGPADGAVVVLCHAAPGSRCFDPDPVATAASGVRLVSVDRPGYGGSDPVPDGVLPTIPRWADDTAAVLDSLGVSEAVLVGWSAGGRVAAAVAARRPDLARALFLVAAPAPDDDVPWIPPAYREQIDQLRSDPPAAAARLAAMLGPASEQPADDLASMSAGPADEAALGGDAGLRARVVAMLAEASRQGHVGLAADIVSYTIADWGFDPAAIGAPTTCVYGGADPIVPPPHGEWWARRIPAADLDVVERAGHLVIVDAWPLALAAASR